MSGGKEDAGSPSAKISSLEKAASIRRHSLLSSLFGRSLSVPYDPSETPLSGEKVSDDTEDNIDGVQQGKKKKKDLLVKLRSKSLSYNDDETASVSESSRPHSFSSVLLGTKQLSMDDGKVLLPTEKHDGPSYDHHDTHNDELENSNVFVQNRPMVNVASPDRAREISQTDHLNRKLLSSFLNRINSMATSFIDPSGTGQTVGQVYSDDVMMDRIIRRVESNRDTNK